MHYPVDMPYALLIITLLLSANLPAAVYKWVDPEGNVSYSDIPDNPNAKQLDLPEFSRYRPRVPEDVTGGDTRTTQGAPADQRRGDAQKPELEIVQPEKNATVRSDEGKVPVVLLLNPALQDGEYLLLMLDGTPVEGQHTSTSMLLEGVLRGPHVLQARLMDENGKTLRSSDSVRFYLRQLTRDEREASATLGERRLTDEQRQRQEQIEQERKAQEDKVLKDQRAQEEKVENLSRQGDFRSRTGGSSLYREDYRGASPNDKRFASGTNFTPLSSKDQREKLQSKTIPSELNAAKNPPPQSGPIPALTNNPAFKPSYAPPSSN